MQINAETRLCATLANPNRKTTAPIMHNAGFDELGVNMRYMAFEPKDIGAAMDAIRSLEFVGVSISKPYKEEVIQYLDELDETAEKIGAVNVVHNTDGKLKGYNSDWIGAIGALEEHVDLKNKTVAVFGAGGAARAIVYGLTKRNVKIHVFNRSEDRGKKLASEFGATWEGTDFEKVQIVNPDIIINATPVGSRSEEGKTLVGKEAMSSVQVVMDVNVRTDNSKFLTDAAANGAKTITGVRMLVLQGVFAFELFSGEKAPVDVMQAAVIEALD